MNLVMNHYTRATIRASRKGPLAQRIIVADDDEDLLEEVLLALLDDGHEVIAVRSGTQLLELLEIIAQDSLRAPDLIAMDVRMPGKSGIEILEDIREAEWPTPVVLFTSYATDDLRMRTQWAGSAMVVEKPRHLEPLRKAVRLGVK